MLFVLVKFQANKSENVVQKVKGADIHQYKLNYSDFKISNY